MKSYVVVTVALLLAGVVTLLWFAQHRRRTDHSTRSVRVREWVRAAPSVQPVRHAAVKWNPGPAVAQTPTIDVEDGEQPREIELDELSIEVDVKFVADLVSERFASLLDDRERFSELHNCTESRGACAELRSEAQRAVLKWPLGPELAQGKLGVRSLPLRYAERAPAAVEKLTVSVLLDTMATSDQRIAAIAFLERMIPENPTGRVTRLPDAAYMGLSQRSNTEAAMLLRMYEAAPSFRGAIAKDIRAGRDAYRSRFRFRAAIAGRPRAWIPRNVALLGGSGDSPRSRRVNLI